MSDNGNAPGRDDPFNLGRFTTAQELVYNSVLAELRDRRKHGHWMWYVFPQVEGLGSSYNSTHYAIRSLDEARAYLHHPTLGARLRECAETLLNVDGRSAYEIMGSPDDKKLKSSMTLFAHVAGPDSVFGRVLEKYFGGRTDGETLQRLGQPAHASRPG